MNVQCLSFLLSIITLEKDLATSHLILFSSSIACTRGNSNSVPSSLGLKSLFIIMGFSPLSTHNAIHTTLNYQSKSCFSLDANMLFLFLETSFPLTTRPCHSLTLLLSVYMAYTSAILLPQITNTHLCRWIYLHDCRDYILSSLSLEPITVSSIK